MAKIIENLHSTILTVGKRILLEDGYEQMTLRRVAGECGIAAGTIYNYFPSKDILVATIMLEDWQRLLEKAKPELSQDETAIAGIERIFDIVREYTCIYQRVWDSYGGSMIISRERHGQLIAQLSGMVDNLLGRFGIECVPNPAEFIAEVILQAGIRRDVGFADIAPFISKILL